MRGDLTIDDIICKRTARRDRRRGDESEIREVYVHLIGCVLRAVFKLSMVLFLSSSSSFSSARSVFLCSTKGKPLIFVLKYVIWLPLASFS